MTIGVPKPTPRAPRERKRLSTRPHPVDPKAAREAYDRDGWLCQWCKRPGGRLVPHHRFRRSQGGRDEARVVVSVHPICHDRLHNADYSEARRRGFIVSDEADLAKGWS